MVTRRHEPSRSLGIDLGRTSQDCWQRRQARARVGRLALMQGLWLRLKAGMCGACLLAILIGPVACGQPAASSAQGAIDPPACTSVTQFGNGQTCSAKDATLANCGTSASRLCASGWLCYDDVAFEQCKCQTNADCAGKRDYVATARALNNMQPIAVSCHGGRCVEGN